MFRPHMGHHQATLIVWEDHCIAHFVLSTLRTIVVVVVVVVVNLLRRIFSSYFFRGRFTTIYIYISMILSLS
jgi:hypothetical protein